MLRSEFGNSNCTTSNEKEKPHKSYEDKSYKRHVISFRINQKKSLRKRPVDQLLHELVGSIEKKVELLQKKTKRKNATSTGNFYRNIKKHTRNLLTNVCLIDLNTENTVGGSSEEILLSRLLKDVIEDLMSRFVNSYPISANVLRIPHFIQNVKSFQVPKYVIYTLLLVGSSILKDKKFFDVFTKERRKRVLKYVTEYMKSVLRHPDCLGIWTMIVLARHYATIGIVSQCTKYTNLAARLGISMKLHMVDAYCISTPEIECEDLVVEKELKRRLWWCLYMYSVGASEGLTFIPAIQLKDVFVNLPRNDYLWHSKANFTISGTKPINKHDVILDSQGGFKLDTYALYTMLFKIRYEIVIFVNRREIAISKDTGVDYRRYLKLFTDARNFQKSTVVRFHNELEKILTFSIRNQGIVNTMNIEYFIIQHCILILNTCVTNMYIVSSEVAHYENVDIHPQRVKSAKFTLIDNTLYLIEVFYWLMSNFCSDKLNLSLILLALNTYKFLINLEYIRNLARHNAIVNGKRVIITYFERLKSTSLLSETFIYLANNMSDLKKSYDKANIKFRNIPYTFKMKMISPYDYNPWMLPNGSSYRRRECCHNSTNTKVHDPFLLSRLAEKECQDKSRGFSYFSINGACLKRIIMETDLKPTIKEAEKLMLLLEDLEISKQKPKNYKRNLNSDPNLDDDPKNFYVKNVDFHTAPQNIVMLEKCKKMIERTFYSILMANHNYTSTDHPPVFGNYFSNFGHKDTTPNLDFTELFYNPIEQGRYGFTDGCDFINVNNTHSNFNSTLNSMDDV